MITTAADIMEKYRQIGAIRAIVVEQKIGGPNDGWWTVRANGQVAHSLAKDECLGVLARLIYGDGKVSYNGYPEPTVKFCTACCRHWEQPSHDSSECPHCGVVALIGGDQK